MIYHGGTLPLFPRTKVGWRDIDELLFRYLSDQNDRLKSTLNNGLRFEDNFDGVFVALVSNAIANTEDTVAHNLGRVPKGYLVVQKNKAADVYDSGTTNTTINLYVKTSVAAATMTLFIF